MILIHLDKFNLCKPLEIQSTSKRYMQSQKSKPKLKRQLDEDEIEEEVVSTPISIPVPNKDITNSSLEQKEAIQNVNLSEATINVEEISFKARIVNLIKTLQDSTPDKLKKELSIARHQDQEDGNATVEQELLKQEYIPEKKCKEAQATDIAMKGIIANIEELANRTNVKIQKSEELTKSWTDHIQSLDAYIKSHTDILKYLKWAACITTIGIFVLKMGLARKIPDFLFSTLSNIPLPSAQAVGSQMKSASTHVKVNENTFNVLMETPLTPLMILTVIIY